MGKKKGFALRIEEDYLNALEAWAADEFRSTNGQVEFLLHNALREAGRLPTPKKTTNTDEQA
jgi:hypothetical protein